MAQFSHKKNSTVSQTLISKRLRQTPLLQSGKKNSLSNNKSMTTEQIQITKGTMTSKDTTSGTTTRQVSISTISQLITTITIMEVDSTTITRITTKTTEMHTQAKTCMTRITTTITPKEMSMSSSLSTKVNIPKSKSTRRTTTTIRITIIISQGNKMLDTLISTSNSNRITKLNSLVTSTKPIFTLKTSLSTIC